MPKHCRTSWTDTFQKPASAGFWYTLFVKNLEFKIEELDNFKVVRDDLYKGGTKELVFERLISNYPENEFVYACDYYGHAAYAIALTALEVDKKVTLFYYSPKVETDVFKKTTSLPNVTFQIIETTKTQVEVGKVADLVLLAANPLDDITNTKKISGVMIKGKWFSDF